MSVFTVVSREQVADFLSRYAVGELIDYVGIQSGIENSNYFVSTTNGRFVLTVFEFLSPASLQKYLELLQELSATGLPTAQPMQTTDGALQQILCKKPAALVERLQGKSIEQVSATHCASVGNMLARLHTTTTSFDPPLTLERDKRWQQEAVAALSEQFDRSEKKDLGEYFDAADVFSNRSLPTGLIHTDLFRDNVLFENGSLSGLIDFYSACRGPYIYDLAVVLLDWCYDDANRLCPTAARSLVTGYAAVREFTEAEHQAWHRALQAAAATFWISRQYDLSFPREGAVITTKDPSRFSDIFRQLNAEFPSLSMPGASARQ